MLERAINEVPTIISRSTNKYIQGYILDVISASSNLFVLWYEKISIFLFIQKTFRDCFVQLQEERYFSWPGSE